MLSDGAIKRRLYKAKQLVSFPIAALSFPKVFRATSIKLFLFETHLTCSHILHNSKMRLLLALFPLFAGSFAGIQAGYYCDGSIVMKKHDTDFSAGELISLLTHFLIDTDTSFLGVQGTSGAVKVIRARRFSGTQALPRVPQERRSHLLKQARLLVGVVQLQLQPLHLLRHQLQEVEALQQAAEAPRPH